MLYMARCILELKTPLHCGSTSIARSASEVTTDAFGLWRIQGATIAGALRNWVYKNKGEQLEYALFGHEFDRESPSSLVSVSDAVLLDFDGTPVWKKVTQGDAAELEGKSFFRDRIGIDFHTGTVLSNQKFNEEYVPVGTRFAFELSLSKWNSALASEEIETFASLVCALQNGEVPFGGRSSCGFGTYSLIECQLRTLDPLMPKEMEQWLRLTDTPLFPKDFGHVWTPKADKSVPVSKAISGTVTLPLCTSDPILIAGGIPEGLVDADLCFATTAYVDYEHKRIQNYLVLPASSLRGVIRHRIYQIFSTLGSKDPLQELQDLFGKTEKNASQRSKLIFFDAPLFVATSKQASLNNCQNVQHVSIDRYTGETIDAHLFNEAPLWQKRIFLSLTVRMNELQPWQAGILLHALLDLAQGALPIGSGCKRGNGRLRLDTLQPITCQLTWNGEELRADNKALAQKWLKRIAQACKEKGYAAAV